MKILITGGKSALALKMLKAFTGHQVILGDYGEMPRFSSKNYKFISLGEKKEDTIAHMLLNNCLDEGIDVILPLHNFEIIPIAKSKVLFNEFNIEVLLPNDSDLANYFGQQIFSKHEDWAVFRKGELLFTSITNNELFVSPPTPLNGAFYFSENHPVANLKLITI